MGRIWLNDYLEDTNNDNSYIKRRGNMALVSSYTAENGVVFSAKKRYIWPSSIKETYSKVVTRRVWGKEA